MSIIKAVLFDFDDTLQDSYQARVNHIIEACRIYGIDFDIEKFRKYYGVTKYHELLELVFGEEAQKASEIFEIEEIYQKYIPSPHEGAIELLKYLSDRNIPTGIISSGNSAHQEVKTNDLKVHNFFYIQTGSDYHYKKPDPRVFDIVLEKLSAIGIAKSEILFVGDHEVDLLAAHHAGLQFAGLRTGPHRHALDDVNTGHGYFIFDDLHQLAQHYFGLEKSF